MNLFPPDPDDVISPPWNPNVKKFEAYKARELEQAEARINRLWVRFEPLSSWDRGLFSFDTWFKARLIPLW